ncbi:SelB domain-containing protein [Ornithinimicrobium ciconiae]|uniref:SelB domain-containing protein n=1 Tax=Ornithinimicrobium ciconiae TaxID=2594265 RepID=UPI0013FCFC13|nr:SelB C-terminal domain-containing protein [Ornithinimicrobium ciconiae]
MKRVLATAGHVDHGKSTLVRALTGRDPDRLGEEKSRGLSIELGFAWTQLPGGADVAFVDVPGHQRFVATTLSGLGPSAAVVFVVAADQGWQAQSSEHLAAVRALGIRDGLLVLTRCDLADPERVDAVRVEASRHLAGAGLALPACTVSAATGEGIEDLRVALDDLVGRMPAPDPQAPARLWCDRSFTISGAGTVVTGTLGAGTLHTGDRLTLLSGEQSREVVVRGLQSEDQPHDVVGPVSRVAVNLRRTETDVAGRSSVLVTPGAYAEAQVIDVSLEPVDTGLGHSRQERATPPTEAILHVGTAAQPAHVRPLMGAGDGDAPVSGTVVEVSYARITTEVSLPWHVGDLAILRDPGDRRLWSLRILDVDPLPLRRRGAGRRRAAELAGDGGRRATELAGDGAATTEADSTPHFAATMTRVRSRSAEHPSVLSRLCLPEPTGAVRVGQWWVDPDALTLWSARLSRFVRDHHEQQPLSHGVPVAEAGRELDLPDHLRPSTDGGTLPHDLSPLVPDLVRHLAQDTGLTISGGRVRAPGSGGLGAAEEAVASLEDRLRQEPFAAPERDELASLGLGTTELAAAARADRLLRLPGDIILLPDGPARAMRELAALEQPFTLSAARQALDTTRRVAVPLLEHLDSRGWTRRTDGQLRQVVR